MTDTLTLTIPNDDGPADSTFTVTFTALPDGSAEVRWDTLSTDLWLPSALEEAVTAMDVALWEHQLDPDDRFCSWVHHFSDPERGDIEVDLGAFFPAIIDWARSQPAA